MKRRDFMLGLGAGAIISTVDWLRFFRTAGIPGTTKTLGFAEAHAAEASIEPRFLIYWNLEGGWDGYSMFNPVDTRNDATMNIPENTLTPNPDWADQIYRPRGYDATRTDMTYGRAKVNGNITYGYLADDAGPDLLNDMAVVSSCYGSQFHSGGRFDTHYGTYSRSMTAYRGNNERTVMQAFAEAYGSDKLMANISWHLWLSDGELSLTSYPEGTGYYEKLGPAYAHTIYGELPGAMRQRLKQIGSLAGNARDDRVRAFADNINQNFLKDKNSASVKAFASAVEIYKSQTGVGLSIDPNTMFTDSAQRSAFGIQASDESASSSSINGNPARTKNTPNTNVQAMMTYELMTKGVSNAFFIESRDLRSFDTHSGRRGIFSNAGQPDQLKRMRDNLWTPLKVLVAKLKSTVVPNTGGKTYYDCTTIVLTSEMGRIMGQVDAAALRDDPKLTTTEAKFDAIMDQDVCQHWFISSAAFLGGTVQGNRQWGKAGTGPNQPSIPLMPDGSLDPNYDATTGVLKSGQAQSDVSKVPDAGSIYSTALYLSGLDQDTLRQQGKGKNTSPALKYIKKA
ncbi:MAG: hypothetical protein H7Z43_00615 [Clostridia bacterium]|nr:hypothetical protein [Deltaproteobacteria bacterium]